MQPLGTMTVVHIQVCLPPKPVLIATMWHQLLSNRSYKSHLCTFNWFVVMKMTTATKSWFLWISREFTIQAIDLVHSSLNCIGSFSSNLEETWDGMQTTNLAQFGHSLVLNETSYQVIITSIFLRKGYDSTCFMEPLQRLNKISHMKCSS